MSQMYTTADMPKVLLFYSEPMVSLPRPSAVQDQDFYRLGTPQGVWVDDLSGDAQPSFFEGRLRASPHSLGDAAVRPAERGWTLFNSLLVSVLRSWGGIDLTWP